MFISLVSLMAFTTLQTTMDYHNLWLAAGPYLVYIWIVSEVMGGLTGCGQMLYSLLLWWSFAVILSEMGRTVYDRVKRLLRRVRLEAGMGFED